MSNGWTQVPNKYKTTDRLLDVGDFIAYNFCGGTGFAWINAYKWHIPKQYENRNGDLITPDPHVVYLCSKLYGSSSVAGPYVSRGYVQDGWQTENPNAYYATNPEYRPKSWPKGMEPKYTQAAKYFLPVYQSDIHGVIDIEEPTYEHSGYSYGHDKKTGQWQRTYRTKMQHHRFNYFDKTKLQEAMDVYQSNDPSLIEQSKKYMANFEKRKAQVLLRKLQS